jgi:hypothetical protein
VEIGWTDVGSRGYILVSCAHSNTSFQIALDIGLEGRYQSRADDTTYGKNPIFRHIKSNNSGTTKVKIVKNERDPPLFTSKLLIKFQNILRNTTQVIYVV